VLNEQWDEFYTILQPLRAPFFFLPGNHDISNDIMRQQWRDRYGATYYAFTYQNVLFLCLDSNDGDGVTINDEQVTYVQQVLAEHPEVHWTMLFLHHPIWDYEDLSGFQEIENALEGRDYTVIAGHRHRYLYEERNDQRYITLATTGGGSQLRGPQFGEYDHIVWVTMSPEGPTLANIQLDGIHPPNLVNPVTREYANHLLQVVQPEQEVLTVESGDQISGALRLRYNNSSDVPLQLAFRAFHHHQLALTEHEWSEGIPAGKATTLTIPFTPLEAGTDLQDIDPIQYQWSLRYQADSLSGLQLSGTETIPIEAKAPITFTPAVDKFLNSQTIGLEYPLEGTSIYYTLDGSEPTQNSAQYTSLISISQTTTLKAVAFRDQLRSPTYEQTYEKVAPLKAQRVRRPQTGLTYEYYEGEWKQLPNFSSLNVQNQGITPDLDVERLAGEREDHFAIRFTGYVEAPEEGMYTLRLRSDDGAKLFIDNQVVIDNDGSHSTQTQYGYVALDKGLHPVEIQYFEDFLGETLDIDWLTPTGKSNEMFTQPTWYYKPQ